MDDLTRSPLTDFRDHPTTVPPDDYRLGNGVAVVRFGASPNQDFFTELVAGAPGAPAGGGSGMARWVPLDKATGQFSDPVNKHPTFETSTVTGSPEQLGATVAAVNFLLAGDLHGLTTGLGEEVILGAPGTEGGSSGSIHVFATRIPTSLIGTDRSAYDWVEYASLTGPAPLSRYGEAIAVWPDVAPPNSSTWFAVGAPGAEEVHIVEHAVFGWPPPLQVKQTLSSTLASLPPGSDFGAALTLEDFDRDGHLDLAIGAPGADTVVIVHGQAGSTPLDTSDILTVTSPLGVASDFGAALASGEIYGQGKEVGLAIGAPTDGDGHVCAIGVSDLFALVEPNNGTATPACGASPLTGSAPHRWGAALAVGNVAPRDGYGQTSSQGALVEEVIVGAPGADRSEWVDSSGNYVASSTGLARGQVTVLAGRFEEGPMLPNGSPVTPDLLPRASLSTGPTGSRFGEALAVADLQNTGHPDIIAGAPGWTATGGPDEYGAVQVLNSDPVGGFDVSEGGVFEVTDSDDRAVDVVAFGTGGKTYFSTGEDTIYIKYVKDDGSICKFGLIDADAMFSLNNGFDHNLGNGDTTLLDDLIIDARTGELLASVPPPGTFDTGDIIRLDVTISDDHFSSSTTTDEVSLTLSDVQIRVKSMGSFVSIYGVAGELAGIASECDIENGPTFTMLRTAAWDPSCD